FNCLVFICNFVCICSVPTASDPCNNYTVLNDSWRTTYRSYGYESYDDTIVNWNGWYRLYLQGKSAQLSEACLGYISCGGYTPLMLNESHPLIQDGIVTREVYGAYYSECRYYKSNPIQVKACPGHYYVYKLVKPNVSIPMPTYCAGNNIIYFLLFCFNWMLFGGVTLTKCFSMVCIILIFPPFSMIAAFDRPTYDPCNNYTSLDQPWRATNAIGLKIYDAQFTWNGWYRIFNYGMDIRMAESCVNVSKCGTYYTLWLNGPHPQIEDGVVARQVCGNSGYRCCFFQFFAIQVKACPNNYYVYEIYNPYYYFAITPTSNNFDPCYNYTALNDYRRGITSSYSGHGNDDTLIQWNGWYRLYYQGQSAQLSEWCVSDVSCGGYTPLILGGTHPKIQDGIVTRDICVFSDGNCNYFSRSNPIQVKACPGQYYVYKLVKPDISIPMPGYCTVSFTYPTTDPCSNYNVLNDLYRATSSRNERYLGSFFTRCDADKAWNGWYRLSYQGNNARLPESCVSPGSCESNAPLWLSGGHPRLEDGIVTRQVCGTAYQDCCYYKSYPIQVKACPGNYYVPYFRIRLILRSDLYITSISAPGILQTTTSRTVATTTTTAHLYSCMKLNCTADEWCGEKDGLYGCFCNESHPRTRDNVYDSRETCESSSAGFPANVLHLSDPSCRGTVQNGRLVFHFDNDDHICGTNLTGNGTHFIYENSIQGVVDSAHGPINRKKHLKLQFSCVYQLRQTLTMETTLYALHSMVHKTLPSGMGMYRVRMIPYQDAAFSHPYNGRVNIVVDQRIYVEVAVQGVDSRQIATVIESCWATPVNDQTFAVRWNLIINKCPNPDDTTVEILQNGVSTTGHFSFKMFSFNGNYSKVFLHCAIHLCLHQGNNCATVSFNLSSPHHTFPSSAKCCKCKWEAILYISIVFLIKFSVLNEPYVLMRVAEFCSNLQRSN
uniref:ZP domain-containing protein n=1 Tax=Pygocentrus nattereri TaxID=42514 RepID=A0A3B4D6V8_PYGNA